MTRLEQTVLGIGETLHYTTPRATSSCLTPIAYHKLQPARDMPNDADPSRFSTGRDRQR